MAMKKNRQVKGAICVNRREITHIRLEAVVSADNPYSLKAIFARVHLAIKAGNKMCTCRSGTKISQELY